jgi:CBS-domain-containing membrane protein
MEIDVMKGEFRKDILRRLEIYVGVSISFGLVSFISYIYDVPLLMAPLAASTCILFVVPESKVARPKNIIFGHMISAAIGVITYRTLGADWFTDSLCIAMAVILMDATDVMHPPAAATSLLALTTGQDFDFILMPVISGACVLVAMSIAVKHAIALISRCGKVRG